MGRADYFALGDWNAICHECGRKRKASELRKHWQGYYVCPEHWEPRQQQDYVRAISEVITPPWSQLMPAEVFLNTCTPNGRTAIPGYAMPGCVIPDFTDPFFVPVANTCTPNGRTAMPGYAMPGCIMPSFTNPFFDPSIAN